MILTADQLKELEDLAGLQFTPDECAVIMGLTREEIAAAIEQQPEVRAAYDRGRLIASAAVRKAIFTQAKQGSTPAQKQMMDLILNTTSEKPAGSEPDNLDAKIKGLKGNK